MDMICPKCKEPFDNEVFHEVAEEMGSTYSAIISSYKRKGCGVAFAGSQYDNASHCAANATSGPANDLIHELYDLLGDDDDGAMMMLEDAESMGLLD